MRAVKDHYRITRLSNPQHRQGSPRAVKDHYRITRLSNGRTKIWQGFIVKDHYRITRLSNKSLMNISKDVVKDHYRITRLSNLKVSENRYAHRHSYSVTNNKNKYIISSISEIFNQFAQVVRNYNGAFFWKERTDLAAFDKQ